MDKLKLIWEINKSNMNIKIELIFKLDLKIQENDLLYPKNIYLKEKTITWILQFFLIFNYELIKQGTYFVQARPCNKL